MIGTHATTVSKDGDHYRTVYHSTTITKWNEEEIILNSGGYYTNTTKRRMNQTSESMGLGFIVFQKEKVWYVDFRGLTFEFKDGMRLDRQKGGVSYG